MNTKDFETVIEEQIKRCKDVLIGKAEEYARNEDRLHNFKNAAGMMGCDPKEALAGMMAKHTISVYDMCRDGKDHTLFMWNEKITDHINYLLLLKAIVMEEKKKGGKLHYFVRPEHKVVKLGDKVEFDCGMSTPEELEKNFKETITTWDNFLKSMADKSTKEWAKKVVDGLTMCCGTEDRCDLCEFQKHHGCPVCDEPCSYTLMKAAKNLIEQNILNSEEKND